MCVTLFPYRKCFLPFFLSSFFTGVVPNTGLRMIAQCFTGEAVVPGSILHVQTRSSTVLMPLVSLNYFLVFAVSEPKHLKCIRKSTKASILMLHFLLLLGATLDISAWLCGGRLVCRLCLRPHSLVISHTDSTALQLLYHNAQITHSDFLFLKCVI